MKKNNFAVRNPAIYSTKRNAFTMAEVLITLGIIGVVAAMTLPTLITQNQNKALEAAFKKNYSIIQQALDMYQAQHGERITSNAAGHTFKNEILPYFNVLRDCGLGQNSKGCVPYFGDGNLDDERNSTKYMTYNKQRLKKMTLFDDGQFVLLDGSLIMIENVSPGTLYITIDVNGYNKNPNRWGHDLFTFQLDEKGNLLPMGAEGTSYNNETVHCSINSNDQYNGIGCTLKAFVEKDYFKNLPR